MGSSPPLIPVFDLQVEPEDVHSVAETLRSGWWSTGPRVQQFEEAFADHLGCRHVVATSSCTTALHLALVCAGVGEGDEVIVPSFTFVATVATVIQAGATPVFADVESLDDLAIDPADVEARITDRTRAVVPVHYAGYPAAVDRLKRVCEERGLALIEDCAHAPSASLDGRRVGTFGDAGCFSFFSNKVLAVGEGGALSTDSDEIAARARLLRSQGMTAGTMDKHTGRAMSYDVVARGFNYKMDDLRAALLLPRLERLGSEIEARRRLILGYRERLDGLQGVSLPYADAPIENSSCYIMVALVEDGRREEAREFLMERGIQTTVHYKGVHLLSAYRERYPDVSLPRTELASDMQVCLPLFHQMTSDQLDRVCSSLREVLA